MERPAWFDHPSEADLDVAVFQSLPLHIRSRVLKDSTVLYARDEEALYAVAIRTARLPVHTWTHLNRAWTWDR